MTKYCHKILSPDRRPKVLTVAKPVVPNVWGASPNVHTKMWIPGPLHSWTRFGIIVPNRQICLSVSHLVVYSGWTVRIERQSTIRLRIVPTPMSTKNPVACCYGVFCRRHTDHGWFKRGCRPRPPRLVTHIIAEALLRPNSQLDSPLLFCTVISFEKCVILRISFFYFWCLCATTKLPF